MSSQMIRASRPVAAIVLVLASIAAPAQAAHKPKPKPKYTYTATIDCGAGPVVVDSTDDMFAPLLDRATKRTYQPVKWNVKVGKKTIRATKPGWKGGRTTACSYDDGQAVGTVTVQRPRKPAHPKHSSHRRGH
jgi:hypothetical protein